MSAPRPVRTSLLTWLWSLPLLAGAAATLHAGVQAPPGTRPNVVLIVADDMGYGDLGVYGATDLKTPRLDRLAREGVRMTDFYANASVYLVAHAVLARGACRHPPEGRA